MLKLQLEPASLTLQFNQQRSGKFTDRRKQQHPDSPQRNNLQARLSPADQMTGIAADKIAETPLRFNHAVFTKEHDRLANGMQIAAEFLRQGSHSRQFAAGNESLVANHRNDRIEHLLIDKWFRFHHFPLIHANITPIARNCNRGKRFSRRTCAFFTEPAVPAHKP